MGNVVKNKKSF